MSNLCDECETVAHCLKHGCIPKVRSTIDMAREAGLAPICEGCNVPDVSYAYESWDEELKAFEALVRADERELRSLRWDEYIAKAVRAERVACWRLCDALWLEGKDAHDCREAIRARGQS